MGATRNTGYIENLIAYDGSDNIGIGSAVNVLYKVTIGGNTLVSGTLNVNSSVTASSFVKTGGTASQILAADGSVITAGTNITISGGTISAGDVGFANPMTTLGDIIYGAASGTATRLAGNTTTTRQFLRQTGTGSVSAAPAWDTVTKTDVGLSNVENTALSTWAGSTNIVTLGTITSGTWNGTTIAIANGGTGQTTKAAAFNALSPMTTLGDIIYGGASGAGTRLAGNTTTSKRFLIQTGDGTNSAAPSWGSIAAGDVPTLNQNTTGSAATLTTARTLTIGATGKTFDGSANVSWSLAEIGAQAALTNPVTGTGTANQIAYWNASGITGSSTFTFTPTSALLVNNSVTAASAIARGVNITSTLVAAANNDALVGVRIAPTFTNGAFTGVSNTALSVVGTSNFKDTITLEASNSTNRWDLYHYTDNTLRFNYNGAGSDEFIITTGGNATFLGTIGASNFSGSSSGTNTGDQDLSGYVTLSTAQNITGSKTFRSVFGGGTGDFTDITTPIIKISPTTGFWRIPFISNDENISGVFNFQTGKNVYWGEVDDTGTYFFRGRGINVQSLTGTSAVFSGDVTSNGNIRINTDTNPTSLTGKQLVLRADSANGGQSLIAMQGYDKTTRWVLNVQTAANTYDYTLYSNTVTIGTAPSYNPKFALTQAGVLRLHNYTTNGFVKFSGGDGTLSVDTNTYLTTTDASNTYLPLTGGALSSSTTTGILSIRSTSASGYSSINFLNNSGTQTGSIGWGNATVPDVIGRNSLYIYSASEGISFLTDSEGISRKMFLSNSGEFSFTGIQRSWSYSSPSTSYKNIDWGGGGVLYRNDSDSYLTANCYYSTTGWKAKYTSAQGVGIWRMLGGDVAWHTYDGSVTAGSVYTLSDKFFISKSGNVGIGEAVDTFPSGDSLLIKNSGTWNVSIGLQNTGTGGRKWNIFSTNDTFGQGGGKFLIYNSTGSSDALIIDSSNNAVFGGNVTATSALKLARSTNNWELYHYTDNTLRFNYNGAGNDEFAIDTTGNAYIRSYLTVGTPTFHTYGILNVWRTVSGTSWGAIADYTNGTDMNLRINISDVGATTKYVELGSYTTNPLVFNYNQGGNVGINHNAPSHKLTVRNGDIAIANHNQASGDFSQAQALHFLNEGVTPLATIKAVRVNWAQGRTDLTFSTYDSGMSEKVRIAYNGAVGIGTTNLTGLTGSCVYIRATSSNVGQTAIAIQDYTGANRWAINGQDGASNYSFNIYSAPTGTNDFTRRLRIGQDGVFSFNSTDTTYTYNFIGGSMYIPGGQSAASTAAYTAWNQLVFGDQYSNVARGPNKIVTYGRGGSWVAGIGVHDDTQAYYAGGTHKFYKFDGTTATLNLSLDGSGNLTATGGFFEGSDMRIKELIQENYQVSGIDAIKPKLYTKHGKTEIGYYAQDFEEIMPHALSVGEDGYLSLSYREVHTAKIASLEARVKELEEQLKQK